MTLVYVCKTSEVPPSTCRSFRVRGRTILICEAGGRFYAHSSTCTHQGLSLDGAVVWGSEIDCPWHHYLFDVRTGENRYPARVFPRDRPDLAVKDLQTFATEVNDGNVFVRLPSRRHER